MLLNMLLLTWRENDDEHMQFSVCAYFLHKLFSMYTLYTRRIIQHAWIHVNEHWSYSSQQDITDVGVDTSYVRIYMSNLIKKLCDFKTSSDRFPVRVTSAVKSYSTAWCDQNLSNHALNALTVLAWSTIEFGRLFQIFTIRAEKCFAVFYWYITVLICCYNGVCSLIFLFLFLLLC